MIEFLFWVLVLPVSIAIISIYFMLHQIFWNWLELVGIGWNWLEKVGKGWKRLLNTLVFENNS